MLLALPLGIFYFTVAVAGLSMSAGLAVLVIGIPFFLLFISFTRILALAEGRLVEGLLGVRMPRRPQAGPRDKSLFGRIKAMLTDPRTWTTILYMLLKLPLGIIYFVCTVVGLSLSLAFICAPAATLLNPHYSSIPLTMNDHVLTLPESLLLAALGVIGLTVLMHVVRAVGGLHGQIAKRLLVSRDGE
jgi:hypothetical protein